MAKPLALTPDALRVAQQTPQAATPARSAVSKVADTPVKAEQMPLQVRLPREDVRAIKIAAAEREQTISDFMLACFHAYMKTCKHE
jgi:hypothetical protein